MAILLAYLWFVCASLRAPSPVRMTPRRHTSRPIARQWTIAGLLGSRVFAVRVQLVAL